MSLPNIPSATFAKQSWINHISPISSIKSICNAELREITENDERLVVLEIVDQIFAEKTGIASVSSSTCLTPERKPSDHDIDQRLKYWKDMLEERKRIAQRIQEKVGKCPDNVLFNRTLEDQEKNMVKRVLDYSERLNPSNLVTKRVIRLREYCDLKKCINVNEVCETLPRAERDESALIEFTGMPTMTKKEQLGFVSCKKSQWLESEFLEKKIEEQREDIERIVEFYPDLENLQIVGESMLKEGLVKHNSEIELLNEDVIKTVSTETVPTYPECKFEVKPFKPDSVKVIYGLKVNEHIYTMGMKRSAQYVDIEVRFECYPFEKVMKRVLHLENVGQNILNIDLVQKNFFPKVPHLLRATDNEFVFETSPFRLISGEKRDIVVLYQPRKVDIVKQQWLLKVEPQFFCSKSDAIVLKLNGRCKTPVEYAQKIHFNCQSVIEKSNTKMMCKLGNNIGGLVPLIKPSEVICPYQRSLNENEIFEQLNPGYTCERFHDLELLKAIYKRVKKPREPEWDFKLQTLFDKSLRLESPDQRAFAFDEINGILEFMKGKPIELETKVNENPERERSRFLYVRGIISAGIEEWEYMAFGIEETFINQGIKIYQTRFDNLSDGASGDSRSMSSEEKEGEELRLYMIKMVRRQKPFRDSLYVQTYTHICNFVEDIVSVIESTDFV